MPSHWYFLHPPPPISPLEVGVCACTYARVHVCKRAQERQFVCARVESEKRNRKAISSHVHPHSDFRSIPNRTIKRLINLVKHLHFIRYLTQLPLPNTHTHISHCHPILARTVHTPCAFCGCQKCLVHLTEEGWRGKCSIFLIVGRL